ncbi:MAG: rod-binding protein [Pseudomonadota bacterium]
MIDATSHPRPSVGAENADPAAARREADLRAAAQGFEALFIAQVLKSGRAASFGGGLGESSAMETTRSLLDTRLAEAGAERGSLGIAEAVYRQFSA